MLILHLQRKRWCGFEVPRSRPCLSSSQLIPLIWRPQNYGTFNHKMQISQFLRPWITSMLEAHVLGHRLGVPLISFALPGLNLFPSGRAGATYDTFLIITLIRRILKGNYSSPCRIQHRHLYSDVTRSVNAWRYFCLSNKRHCHCNTQKAAHFHNLRFTIPVADKYSTLR
jgi:hypothetical protein